MSGAAAPVDHLSVVDGRASALAALGLSPRRLRRLLAGRTASAAWQALADGVHPEDPDGRLRTALGRTAPAVWARRCAQADVAVAVLGDDGYPAALAGDEEAPAVLFGQGAIGVLDAAPRVGVVGTRSASTVGREVAEDMGRCLALAGVTVVSG
ncbi:MAG: DNA-processing protein DprA, partial [Acidobacteriota bacterium]|nr:DNA-processing protein DprA [Acidobacteriota bacterium]